MREWSVTKALNRTGFGNDDPGNRAAMRALAAIYRPGHQYKKAGVLFLELWPAAAVQSGLFDVPDSPRSQARMRAIDHLNRRFGRDTVSYAVAGVTRGWKLRSEFISPRFTTSWDELLAVGAPRVST